MDKQAKNIIALYPEERRSDVEYLIYGNDIVEADDFQDPSLPDEEYDIQFPFVARVIPHRTVRASEKLPEHALRGAGDDKSGQRISPALRT